MTVGKSCSKLDMAPEFQDDSQRERERERGRYILGRPAKSRFTRRVMTTHRREARPHDATRKEAGRLRPTR